MRFSTRDITKIGIFAAVTVVLSQIAIPLPFTPVQLSLGIVAVFAAGIMLSPAHAFLSQIVYLMLGAFGLPVFQGFSGGIARLFGPTGGYLAAYPLMALIISSSILAYSKLWNSAYGMKFILWSSAGILISLALCYTLGTVWLSHVTNVGIREALAMAVYPFIPLDLAKTAFCAVCLLPLRERFNAVFYAGR